MLRRVLFVVLLLSMNQAWASKARLMALGQDADGSYYILDTRSMFLNPAQVGVFGEQLSLEWGDSARPPAANSGQAEGSFISKAGPGYLGVSLGREMSLSSTTRVLNQVTVLNNTVDTNFGATDFPEPTDTVEIIYGATGADLNWGGALMYGRNKDEDGTGAADKTQAIEFRGGVASSNWQANARLAIGGKSEDAQSATTTVQYEGDLGARVGGALNLSESVRAYADVEYETFELSQNGNNAGYDGNFTSYKAGIAKWRPIDANSRFFYAGEFEIINLELKGKGGAVTGKAQATVLPLVVGIEADAASWLKLRGSVSQSVLISGTKLTSGATVAKDEHVPNSTTVAAGAGLMFNKFLVDATFGGTSTGTLNANNVFANVSMNYTF